MQARRKLLFFGYSYTAAYLRAAPPSAEWDFAATVTTPEKQARLQAEGVDASLFDALPLDLLHSATHILLSIPPDENGDPVFARYGQAIAASPSLQWLGYLSATSVYGDCGGAWIDETAPLNPCNARGILRVEAERQWRALPNIAPHIFRLTGIYGPGRSAIDNLRAGKATRIDKPGHAFNRIHVEDIAQILAASIARADPGAVYNLADDLPASSADVIAYAATRLGLPVPPLIPYDRAEMSPMTRSFYAESKLVRNDKIKEKLNVTLRHPDYRRGIDALLDAEKQN